MTKIVVWNPDYMDPFLANTTGPWESYGRDGPWIRQLPHVLNYSWNPLQLHVYFAEAGELQDWCGNRGAHD